MTVSVRARFERFPATVKGAFILRGEDADPHQVRIREARAAGIGIGVTRVLPMAAALLDVAPHRDVFVPFELGMSDLDPGWYTLECDLEVDGVPGTYDGGRRFSVAWPRATVRRGQIEVERRVTLGSEARVQVEHVDCTGDSIRIHVRVDPPGPITPRLSADGSSLEVLEVELDESTGRAKITGYPLMRMHRTLRIELRGKGRGTGGSLEVRLP
ncbi:MAG TPA: hypothetical protein VE669_11955 [Actinomycetota bacterium]|nr:hypothetical protein [Actinomycetota bacterium]